MRHGRSGGTTLLDFARRSRSLAEVPIPNRLTLTSMLKHVFELSAEATIALQATARRLQLTFNTLVQAAWALQFSRQAGIADVVFGAAFSGRPADLHGVESIVGPFVNNLPVRVLVDGRARTSEFCASFIRAC